MDIERDQLKYNSFLVTVESCVQEMWQSAVSDAYPAPQPPQIFSHLVPHRRASPNGSVRCVVMEVSLKWSQYHMYLDIW